MIKYAKVINEEVGLVAVGIGADREYYKSIGFTEQEVELSDKDNCWYLKGYAPMKTDEEKAQQEAECRIQEIKSELDELDLQAIRPLRAILAGTQTDEDLQKLKEIENLAAELRIKLQPLKNL